MAEQSWKLNNTRTQHKQTLDIRNNAGGTGALARTVWLNANS
jgi:hypothetical protein